jgi:glycosyltransferase involved in cell wall biosynthesis
MSEVIASHSVIEAKPVATRRRLISICTPAFNEEANVEACYKAVVDLFDKRLTQYDWEWIITDNHSEDATFEKVRAIAAADPRVRGIRFSRNFGYQRSIFAGYAHASGDAAVQLDCDLEDPPAIIEDFVRLWERGHEVVYGIRRTRQEPMWLQRVRRTFYWALDKVSEDRLPRDVGDFRLIDRRILDELARVDDPHIYIRGRIASMGFRQVGIPYDRDARRAGASKFNPGRLALLAVDATLSHSVLPLRIATVMGLALCAASVLLILVYALAKFVQGAAWPAGFTTTVVLILLGMGINGLFLGIIGEYLARIHQHLKGGHLRGSHGVIVMETVGKPPARD